MCLPRPVPPVEAPEQVATFAQTNTVPHSTVKSVADASPWHHLHLLLIKSVQTLTSNCAAAQR